MGVQIDMSKDVYDYGRAWPATDPTRLRNTNENNGIWLRSQQVGRILRARAAEERESDPDDYTAAVLLELAESIELGETNVTL